LQSIWKRSSGTIVIKGGGVIVPRCIWSRGYRKSLMSLLLRLILLDGKCFVMGGGTAEDKEKLILECADIANFAMMLADNARKIQGEDK
jgi:hypothetical protein